MWPGEVTTSIERKWLAHWLVLFSDNNNNYSRRRIWFPSLLGRVREKNLESGCFSPSLSFFSLSTHSRRGYTFLSRLYIHSLLLLYTDIRLFFFYLKKKKNPYISNIPLWTFGRGIIRRRGNNSSSSNVFKRPLGEFNFFRWKWSVFSLSIFKAFYFIFRATGKTGEETPTSCGNDIPPHLQGKTTSLNFQRISSSL